jgi:hypothetical protein
LKVGKTTPVKFEARVKEVVAGHTKLEGNCPTLLAARAVLRREFNGFERLLRGMARGDTRARLVMPGVGTIVALTYASPSFEIRPVPGEAGCPRMVANRAGRQQECLIIRRSCPVGGRARTAKNEAGRMNGAQGRN